MRENQPSKQTGWTADFSVLVQPPLLTCSCDLLFSFHEEFPYDVYFHLLLESRDLDIIKALNKMDLANRAD